MKRVDQLMAGMTDEAMQDDRRLRQTISRIVPAPTLQQLAFCRLEHGVLHLSVTNAAWLTRLRFIERSLVAELRTAGREVHTVRGHVLPRRSPVRQRQASRPAPAASAAGANSLQQLADSLEDGRLKTALCRAAGHLRNPARQPPGTAADSHTPDKG